MRYSLSLFLVSFFSSSPFFLPFSFPFKFAEIAYWKPENWTGTLAIFHTCRAISPPPSPRSVAVRTIIAAWIIAESNNKRPWSPPLPTGLLCDLTFVQHNGRDYELFTHPSLPPFETWRAIRKRKRRRCTRSVSLEIRGDISFFDGEEKIVEEFCIILYNVELKYWYLIYLYFKKEFFLCI